MIGGGFIGQMMDTMKYNRALLGKSKRKPFEKSDYKESNQGVKLVDNKVLSENERELLLQKLKSDARLEVIRKGLILILSIGVTCFLFWLVLQDVK